MKETWSVSVCTGLSLSIFSGFAVKPDKFDPHEFDVQDSHGGRRELTPKSCPLTCTPALPKTSK